ncbi:putative ATP citrate synthase [Cavenderia fasciculata]|uniref:ATP citrate synthase n=1 Tax=Cavenderia fasciculata TaxID=261658 RepID=F4Q1N2_CACFS|nr:putative ATP citrate synthase [Cavenderia fasciculata]EGG18733.1 putative ATP citrate synthase [Cavenderia fasciculata]|eukprot:XP_004366637.1 putative ATP citrate synthase [Cavenderia fasciculata]
MARKKIREYSSKSLLKQHLASLCNERLNLKMVQVQQGSLSLVELMTLPAHSWLQSTKLVVKPDMLFGKRGKNNLVLLNATVVEADQFIKERMGKSVTISGKTGPVTHFIVEPFVPHAVEYYLSVVAKRDVNTISFSSCGGMEIEELWDKVKSVDIAYGDSIDTVNLHEIVDNTIQNREYIIDFIKNVYKIFEELSFHFIEMNPFTLDQDGKPFPLDMRGEIDECASFKCGNKWMVDGDPIQFPQPFGRELFQEETFINDIDEKTGASLKLTLLNPTGRIWAMVAGGGASVIYADTVADLGYGHELGNYGEYSGDPNEEDTNKYASTMLSLATRNPDGRPRALLIGGGIANFTDVAVTFKGIIHAIKQYSDEIVRSNLHIFVRRGGPNYQSGLQHMREIGHKLQVPIKVFGPEVNMTSIVSMAIQHINTSPNIDPSTALKNHSNGNGNGNTNGNGSSNGNSPITV